MNQTLIWNTYVNLKTARKEVPFRVKDSATHYSFRAVHVICYERNMLT